MALLKRRNTVEETPVETVEDEVYEPIVGKGRPTPKRSAARAARPKGGSSLSAPTSPTARGGSRDDRRKQTAQYRSAMQSTDVNKLPARERAPERVLARDIVDTRRNVGPLFLIAAVVYFAGAIVPSPAARLVTTVIMLVGMVAVIGDSVLLGIQVTRRVQDKYPGTRVKVRAYAVQRALLPRRWRLPKPRVSRQSPTP